MMFVPLLLMLCQLMMLRMGEEHMCSSSGWNHRMNLEKTMRRFRFKKHLMAVSLYLCNVFFDKENKKEQIIETFNMGKQINT